MNEALKQLEDATYGNGAPAGTLKGVVHDIREMLLHYIEFPHSSQAILVAYWIVCAYCYDAFRYAPYLSLKSATPRSGKSRLLSLIAFFLPQPCPIITVPTPAVLEREDGTRPRPISRETLQITGHIQNQEPPPSVHS